jgi:hypothetical protein
MEKERVLKYINNVCIVILKNRLKYEGLLKTFKSNSLIINDKILGSMEIDIDLIGVIIPIKEKIE